METMTNRAHFALLIGMEFETLITVAYCYVLALAYQQRG